MANVNGPFGFAPAGCAVSGGIIVTRVMSKAVGYGTAIFPGDMVGRANDGSIDRELTPGTTYIQGVSLSYGAASTATEHLIIDNPWTVLVGQADGALAAADMGLNANFAKGTGDASLIRSKDVINSATEATTGSLDLHLIERLKEIGNDYGAYVKLLVTINKHRLFGGIDGV